MGRSMGGFWLQLPTRRDCLDIDADDARLEALIPPEDTSEPGESCAYLYAPEYIDCQLEPWREAITETEPDEDEPLNPPWLEETAQMLADYFEEKNSKLDQEIRLDVHLICCFPYTAIPKNIPAICTSRAVILCHTPPGANATMEQLLQGFCLEKAPCQPIVCEEGWLH